MLQEDFVIRNSVLEKYKGNDNEVVVPNGVISIGASAFEDCQNLKKIVLPESVTSIGNRAFCGCENLEKIVLPESVTSIGDSAFDECDKITIFTVTGSYAEKYAKENHIKVVTE